MYVCMYNTACLAQVAGTGKLVLQDYSKSSRRGHEIALLNTNGRLPHFHGIQNFAGEGINMVPVPIVKKLFPSVLIFSERDSVLGTFQNPPRPIDIWKGKNLS